MIKESSGTATKDTRAWTKDTKCTKGNFVARRAAGVLRRTRGAWTKDTKGTKSSGAATKDSRSVDEGHEVYEEQRGCYERAAK